jgi:hypothetical protein
VNTYVHNYDARNYEHKGGKSVIHGTIGSEKCGITVILMFQHMGETSPTCNLPVFEAVDSGLKGRPFPAWVMEFFLSQHVHTNFKA